MTTLRNHAVLVGVGLSPLDAMSGPPHAEQDVLDLADVLQDLGLEEDDISILTGESASRDAIESRIREIAESLSAEPGRLFVYLSGPMFSRTSRNYLACHDTTIEDPEASSLDLSEMIRLLRKARRSRIQIYLDCGRGNELGVESADDTEADARSPISLKMIDRSLRGVEHVTVFGSSRPGQRSFTDPRRHRGIWAEHIVAALSGQVPELLNGRGILLADTLQRYLEESVPRTVRDTSTDRRKKQTPWRAGAANTPFEVADVSALAGAASRRAPLQVVMKAFGFRREVRVRVKTLSGFKAGVHHLPKWSNHQTEQFVAQIAESEIERDIHSMFMEIRQNLNYRRKQIEVRPPEGGEASIRTPDFQYTVSVRLDEDPAIVVITREFSDIRRPESLAAEAIARTFDGLFDSARVQFDRSISIENLIDLAEASGVPVTYPPDCSSCALRAVDGAVVNVLGESLVLKYSGTRTIDALVGGLGQLMRILPTMASLPAPTSLAGPTRREK